MAQKNTLSAKQVLADIQSGITDDQLIQKYGISAKGLQSFVGKLIKAGLITQAEMDQRSKAFEQTVGLAPETLKRSPAAAESNRDVFQEFGQRFNIPPEDLERLRCYSIKDISAFLKRHHIPSSEGIEFAKALGFTARDFLNETTGKPKRYKPSVNDLFRIGKKGQKLFFPWGAWGRGYVIPSDEEYVKIRRAAKLWYNIALPCWAATIIASVDYFVPITDSFWKDFSFFLVLFIVPYTACYWAWFRIRRQLSPLVETDEPYPEPY